MNNEEKKKNTPAYDYHEHDFDFLHMDNVASSSECTGLIQTPPLSDEEAESYTNIYNIPKAQPADENRKHQKSK